MKYYLKELVVVFALAAVFTIGSFVFAPPAAANTELELYAAQIEETYNLPPYLLRSICAQESRWRNVAGRHGEIGVCQIKPSTVSMVCPECAGNATRKLFTLGSRGDEVARIQAVLAREGYYTHAIDGVFGRHTHAAVLLFQQHAHIAIDGIVGPQTWRSLFGAHDPYPGLSVVEALWDPHQNIEWAARILVWLRENVSPAPMVMAAAYNGGPGNPIVRYMVQVRARYAGVW